MFDEKLRASVLKLLHLEDATKEEQDVALLSVESIANRRFARALPDLLTDSQLDHTESMRAANKSDEEIVKWIQEQLPNYDEMMNALIQDVAEELTKED